MLSDPEKRKIYDLQGEEGVNEDTARKAQNEANQNMFRDMGGMNVNMNFDDIFNKFFGEGAQGPGGTFKFSFGSAGGGGFGGGFNQNQVENYFKDSAVVNIDMGNLSTFYRRKYVWVVFFYNREKNDVQKLAEEFRTLAAKMKGIIEVGAVDCQENDEICEELGVKSKSHVIKIYSEKISDSGQVYKGKIEWKSLSNSATSKMESFVSIVTNENYNDFMNREKNNIKLLLFSNKKNIPPLYKALSKFSKLISFGLVKEGDSLQSNFGIKSVPSV